MSKFGIASGKGCVAISLLIVGLLFTPVPASAQFSDSYKFLQSVRKKEGNEVQDALDKSDNRIVSTKDSSTGETALHIVAARRDLTWLTFLISKGADVNAHDGQGRTPLQIAASLGWRDGVEYLVANRALPDETNDAGETPLISAVHQQDAQLIKILLAAGADPDRADNSGRTARDYASAPGVNSNVRSAIAGVTKRTKSTPSVYGPVP